MVLPNMKQIIKLFLCVISSGSILLILLSRINIISLEKGEPEQHIKNVASDALSEKTKLGELPPQMSNTELKHQAVMHQLQPRNNQALHKFKQEHKHMSMYRRRYGFQCQDITFAKDNLPLTALASFPGSGNTWVRHLVQQATGFYTGSVYNDGDLIAKGFLGEHSQNRSVVLIKTHMGGLGKYERAVLLTRNPYDALMAEYNWMHGGHTGYAKQFHFTADAWNGFVNSRTKGWINFHLKCLEFNGSLFILNYESLKTNLRYTINELVNYLIPRPITEDMLDCVVNNSLGHFYRHNIVNNQSNISTPSSYYNVDMKSQIDSAQKKVRMAIEHRLQEHRYYTVYL